MNIYNQSAILVFILICFGIFKLFKKIAKDDNEICMASEESLNQLDDLNKLHEKKIRKHWLISFLVMCVIWVLSIFLIIVGEGLNEFTENAGLAFTLIFGLAFSLLLITPWFWITYHCSYKKKGTAWLMWTMISMPLRELVELAKGEWNQVDLSVVAIFLGIEVYYWVNCLRLHRVNSVYKHIYGPDEECTRCVSSMQNASNIPDLDSMLYYAIGKWPQWEKQLSKVHLTRKNWLSKSLNSDSEIFNP